MSLERFHWLTHEYERELGDTKTDGQFEGSCTCWSLTEMSELGCGILEQERIKEWIFRA